MDVTVASPSTSHVACNLFGNEKELVQVPRVAGQRAQMITCHPNGPPAAPRLADLMFRPKSVVQIEQWCVP